MWFCQGYPRCKSYVACHEGTTIPLGTLAAPRLRSLRARAHDAFDPLWKLGGDIIDREMAYRVASAVMGRPDLHIGWLDERGCIELVERIAEIEQALLAHAQHVLEAMGRATPAVSSGAGPLLRAASMSGAAQVVPQLDDVTAAILRVVFEPEGGQPLHDAVPLRRLESAVLPIQKLAACGVIEVLQLEPGAEACASLTPAGLRALGVSTSRAGEIARH